MIAGAAAIARRELRALARSWWAIALTLAVPLLLASLIAAAFPTVNVLETDAPFQTSRIAQAVALEIVFIMGFAVMARIASVFATRRDGGELRHLRRLRLADAAIVSGIIAPFILVALAQLVLVAAGTMIASGSWPRQPLLLAIAVLIAPFFFTSVGMLAAAFVTGPRSQKCAIAVPFGIIVTGAIWLLFSAGTANALHLGVPGAGISELVRLAWTADLPVETISAAAGRAAGMSVIWTAAITFAAWRFFRWEPYRR